MSQYIGGFKGVWNATPSGDNCELKLELLQKEGVRFDQNGKLMDTRSWWDDFKVGNVDDLNRSFTEFERRKQ